MWWSASRAKRSRLYGTVFQRIHIRAGCVRIGLQTRIGLLFNGLRLDTSGLPWLIIGCYREHSLSSRDWFRHSASRRRALRADCKRMRIARLVYLPQDRGGHISPAECGDDLRPPTFTSLAIVTFPTPTFTSPSCRLTGGAALAIPIPVNSSDPPSAAAR